MATYSTPQLLLASQLCRRFEGYRDRAYVDCVGVVTIGYGSTGPDIKLGMTCDKLWAEQRLLKDLSWFWSEVYKASPILLTQPPMRGAAVLDWTYNLGAGRYRASTLRKRVNAGRWDDAAAEMRKWVYGGGKKLRGLELRRDEEVKYLLLLADIVETGALPLAA